MTRRRIRGHARHSAGRCALDAGRLTGTVRLRTACSISVGPRATPSAWRCLVIRPGCRKTGGIARARPALCRRRGNPRQLRAGALSRSRRLQGDPRKAGASRLCTSHPERAAFHAGRERLRAGCLPGVDRVTVSSMPTASNAPSAGRCYRRRGGVRTSGSPSSTRMASALSCTPLLCPVYGAKGGGRKGAPPSSSRAATVHDSSFWRSLARGAAGGGARREASVEGRATDRRSAICAAHHDDPDDPDRIASADRSGHIRGDCRSGRSSVRADRPVAGAPAAASMK